MRFTSTACDVSVLHTLSEAYIKQMLTEHCSCVALLSSDVSAEQGKNRILLCQHLFDICLRWCVQYKGEPRLSAAQTLLLLVMSASWQGLLEVRVARCLSAICAASSRQKVMQGHKQHKAVCCRVPCDKLVQLARLGK